MLTPEQKRRIEENRQRALKKRQKRVRLVIPPGHFKRQQQRWKFRTVEAENRRMERMLLRPAIRPKKMFGSIVVTDDRYEIIDMHSDASKAAAFVACKRPESYAVYPVYRNPNPERRTFHAGKRQVNKVRLCQRRHCTHRKGEEGCGFLEHAKVKGVWDKRDLNEAMKGMAVNAVRQSYRQHFLKLH